MPPARAKRRERQGIKECHDKILQDKEINMKRSILYVLLTVILLFGCSEGLKGVESDYTIKVTGADQLPFSGHYTIAGTGAIPKPVQVAGKVPMEFAGKGLAAACVIRKTTVEGKLKVEILHGKEIVSTAETAAPYGIITLGRIPDTNSIINQILGKILG
jgi:thioredoxin reductase